MKPPPPTRVPVLFDTDLGTNVDDALALGYLLRQPGCQLMGITCTHPQPRERARLVSAICHALGHPEVPIHAGLDRPPSATTPGRPITQEAILERWNHRADFPAGTAIDFLRETIRAHPGQITLLAVGPLTNLAALFAADPQIPSLLRRVVMMGGVYLGAVPGYGFGEYNTISDPSATTTIINAEVKETWCVGLDVTLRCRQPADEVQRRLVGADLAILRDLLELWRTRRHQVLFHDALAAATIFEPQLCAFVTGSIRTANVPGDTGYRMRFEESGQRHHVAVSVEPERFFQHYFDILTGTR